MKDFQFPSIKETDDYLRFIEECIEPNEHCEKHHIYPKSIFGDNSFIKKLSYKDHFFAHYLLVKLYEAAGMKSEYLKMSKAFFSFIRCNEYRLSEISSYSDDDITVLGCLFEEAKIENSKSSNGENNPFYGKSHSPETIEKILNTKKTRNSMKFWTNEKKKRLSEVLKSLQNKKVIWVTNVETRENRRVSENDLNNISDEWVLGRYTSDEERLHRSYSAKESSHNLTYEWVRRGDEHEWSGTKHIKSLETGENRRLKISDEIPSGFVLGLNFSQSHLDNLRMAASKRRGRPQPHVIEINKNPSKIKKTADKNRGTTRTESQKLKMSLGRRKFIANGGKASTAGTKRLFNKLSKKFVYVPANEVSNSMKENLNLTDEAVRLATNMNGDRLYVCQTETLPNGFEYVLRK